MADSKIGIMDDEPMCRCGHGVSDHNEQDPGACLECPCAAFDEIRPEPMPEPPQRLSSFAALPAPWGWSWWRRSALRAWLRAVLGMRDDLAAGHLFMRLTSGAQRTLGRLIEGLRGDLGAFGADYSELKARVEFYERESATFQHLRQRYEKDKAVRLAALRVAQPPPAPEPEPEFNRDGIKENHAQNEDERPSGPRLVGG